MYHSNKELLQHIFDEVNYVLKVCTGKTKDDLMDGTSSFGKIPPGNIN